jgi:hypothetical protein
MTGLNPELTFTLEDAVAEVLGLLTGLDLQYDPQQDRFYSITRQLNRALRHNALEREWSYYSDTADIGVATDGQTAAEIPSDQRARMMNDDCVRLVDSDDIIRRWAYFLPRDAIHKYSHRNGLWVAVVRNTVLFSRPLDSTEEGWTIQIPVMREPTWFRLPEQPESPTDPLVEIPTEILEQPVDFPYPDLICSRAAYYVAQSDPVMQPRAQTLQGDFKDLMYQIIERDERMTDSPELNPFFVPIEGSLHSDGLSHRHPHSDERR